MAKYLHGARKSHDIGVPFLSSASSVVCLLHFVSPLEDMEVVAPWDALDGLVSDVVLMWRTLVICMPSALSTLGGE